MLKFNHSSSSASSGKLSGPTNISATSSKKEKVDMGLTGSQRQELFILRYCHKTEKITTVLRVYIFNKKKKSLTSTYLETPRPGPAPASFPTSGVPDWGPPRSAAETGSVRQIPGVQRVPKGSEASLSWSWVVRGLVAISVIFQLPNFGIEIDL